MLGPALLGAYLYGSATASGLRPASDLDVLAVTPANLTDAQRRTLTDELLLVSGLSEEVRPVELLVLARVWTTVATGEIRAKDTAADWVLHRLPAGLRPPLAHARDLYRDTSYADERWSLPLRAQARPLADHMVAEIHVAAQDGSPPPLS